MSQSFKDVKVSIPVSAAADAAFTELGVGRIEVQEDFASPSGASCNPQWHLEVWLHLPAPVAPRSLGYLSRASAVPEDQVGCTLDAKMGPNGLYRLKFKSGNSAESFARLAEKAMMEEFGQREANEVARNAESKALINSVRDKLSGRRPLLFAGVQLLGPDSAGEAGSEVLLGEGILALLDPNWRGGNDTSDVAASRNIGEYELRFYSDECGAGEAVKQILVGPKMTLEAQERSRAEFDDEEEPAKMFTLSLLGGPLFTLTFDCLETADSFERDFVVRQRLMDVGLMTARRMQSVNELKSSTWYMKAERTASRVLLIPVLILVLAWKSTWVAKGLSSFLLPDDCAVHCFM